MPRSVVAAAALSLLALTIAGSGSARPTAGPRAVFFETNSLPKNYVQVLWTDTKGSLKKGPLVATGGTGSNKASAFSIYGFPLLDSANSVVLSDDGTLLFAVNAGSNSVSSFRVTASDLTLVDNHPSGGKLPVSVATATKNGKTLVYVVNEWSGNVMGFTAGSDGKLTPLAGSKRSLVTHGRKGAAAMIGFDSTTSALTVTERGAIYTPVSNSYLGSGPNLIDTFKVDANGVPGPAIRNKSLGEDPYGFAYAKDGRLFMTDSGIKGTVSSYSLNPDTAALKSGKLVSAGGSAPCWVVLSADQKFAFVTNSLSGTVSRFSFGSDGSIKLLGHAKTTNNAALDEDSSGDGKYLYVLATKVVQITKFKTTRIDSYRIGADGSLTLVGQTGQLPFPGASGLAAT